MAMHRLAGGIIPLLGDRVELANGIECRLPFLDLEVIKVACKLPEHFFLDTDQWTEKKILRSAFANTLPLKVARQKKHPFLAPQWRTMLSSSRGKQILGDMLTKEAIQDAGLFSYATVIALKTAWKALPKEQGIVNRLDPLLGLILTAQILNSVLAKDRYSYARIVRPLTNMRSEYS